MKWIKLSSKQEPEFGIPLLVWFDNDVWVSATLDSIRQDFSGKQYIFIDERGSELIQAKPTHFCLPDKPKD